VVRRFRADGIMFYVLGPLCLRIRPWVCCVWPTCGDSFTGVFVSFLWFRLDIRVGWDHIQRMRSSEGGGA